MKIEGSVFKGLILLGTACSIDQAVALQNCQSIPRNSMTLEQFTQCYAGDGANATNTYDYIVVGAGAAGSVVSARLAQAGKKVLVLEAGPDTSPTSGVPDLPGILVPILSVNYSIGHTFDPNVSDPFSCSQLLASNTNLDFISKSDNSTKYYAYPRGAGAGGTAQNAAGYVDGIGSMKLYDKIAAYLQDPFWQGDNILRIAKKMEKMPAGYNPSYYGNAGWLHSSKSSIEIQDPIYAKILNGANSIGLPTRTDFRAPDQRSGIGLIQNSVYSPIAYPGQGDGFRSYSYKDLLLPTLLNPQNDIRVKFNTLVGQVILKNNQDDQSDISQNAIGVEVFEKPYLQKVQSAGGVVIDGTNGRCLLVAPDKTKPSPTRYFARKEIIISAGAIQTPQLLMLSGIGDPKQLKANNIVPKVNLPGVGKNLMDHPEIFVQFEMDPRKWYGSPVSTLLTALGVTDLFVDQQIKSTIIAANKPGLFVDGPVGLVLDWPSGIGDSTDPAEPDIHAITWAVFSPIDFDLTDAGLHPLVDEPSAMYQHPARFFEPIYNNPLDPVGVPTRYSSAFAVYNPFAPRMYFSWLIENLRPSKVTGTVTLQSTDPAIPPKLDMGLERDEIGIRRLAAGVMLIRQIMSDPAIKELALDPDNFELQPGKYAATLTDVENYIKTWTAFGHHPSGGAAMGPKGNKMSVLDSKLRVRHVGGLRVADTSVYPAPYIHGYNTTRAAYIVGEAASELILEDCTDD